VRQVWGDGKGRFQTRGRYAAATVRGTKWRVQDRCDGTFVTVARGVVAVRDFGLRRSVLVRAGQSYLARR
jgi:ferric-dicitrate binding protein FerR (iron transport regulator)